MQKHDTRSARMRAIFNELRDKHLVPNAPMPADTVTASTLIEEVVLNNNSSSYVFQFNKSNPVATERILNRNDNFRATDMFIGIKRERRQQVGTGILRTYPNPGEFGAQARHLETIYNGTHEIEVNQTRLAEGQSNLAFKYVPQNAARVLQDITVDAARYNAQTYPISPDADPTRQLEHLTANLDEFELGMGMLALEPLVIFEGFSKNRVTVSLPNFIGLDIAAPAAVAPAPEFDHKLVVMFFGYLIAGVNKGR